MNWFLFYSDYKIIIWFFIEWEYSYVWKFLRGLTLPYPDLYDKGYTSLGSQSNTLPNPNLAKKNGTFEPAFKLQDGALERAGRGKKASWFVSPKSQYCLVKYLFKR